MGGAAGAAKIHAADTVAVAASTLVETGIVLSSRIGEDAGELLADPVRASPGIGGVRRCAGGRGAGTRCGGARLSGSGIRIGPGPAMGRPRDAGAASPHQRDARKWAFVLAALLMSVPYGPRLVNCATSRTLSGRCARITALLSVKRQPISGFFRITDHVAHIFPDEHARLADCSDLRTSFESATHRPGTAAPRSQGSGTGFALGPSTSPEGRRNRPMFGFGIIGTILLIILILWLLGVIG